MSPDRAHAKGGFEPVRRSPLERALRHAPDGVVDLSGLGKIEVRGELDALDVDAEVVRITPRRALVLCPHDRAAKLRSRLREQGLTVIDQSGALAGLEVEGEQPLRRLTELDLDALPAVGSVAHVQTILLREGATFRLFFPQELGHFLAEVVLDALEGLR